MQSAKICAILFVPHILDSGASTRNGYIETLAEVAKGFRGKPVSFAWSEAGAQVCGDGCTATDCLISSAVL